MKGAPPSYRITTAALRERLGVEDIAAKYKLDPDLVRAHIESMRRSGALSRAYARSKEDLCLQHPLTPRAPTGERKARSSPATRGSC